MAHVPAGRTKGSSMTAPEPSPELRAVTAEHLQVVGPPPPTDTRSLPRIVRDIATDPSTLVRKEIELAKQELGKAIGAKLMAVAAFGAAGVMAVFMIFFFGFAGAY